MKAAGVVRSIVIAGSVAWPALAGLAASGPEWVPVVYEQPFKEASSLKEIRVTDPRAWRWTAEAGGGVLELFQQSRYQAPIRSPFNIALLSRYKFRDFVLEAECQQTSREYGHRDLCFFFGLQAPTRFYYVHLASAADDHAHNVFRVNETPRVKIGRETTKGVEWGAPSQWHKVRIERKAGEGTIRVFFDDMAKPIMTAVDRTFEDGFLGLGSFDDEGRFRNVRIEGSAMEGAAASFYTAP